MADSKVVGVIKQVRLRRYKAPMLERKKTKKGGHCHTYELMDMNFLNKDPTAMEVFRRTGVAAEVVDLLA